MSCKRSVRGRALTDPPSAQHDAGHDHSHGGHAGHGEEEADEEDEHDHAAHAHSHNMKGVFLVSLIIFLPLADLSAGQLADRRCPFGRPLYST